MKFAYPNKQKKYWALLFFLSVIFLGSAYYSSQFFFPASWVISPGVPTLQPPLQPSGEQAAERITQACQDSIGDQTAHEKCTARKFASAGERWGIEFIGTALTAYQSINTGYQSYQSCHVLAHRIMGDLASRKQKGWKTLLEEVNVGQFDPTRCGGGFLHGILEARLSEDPDFQINADTFQEICADGVKKEVSHSCAHILGHLALVQAFEASGDLDTALKACDGLSGDFLFQCYGGIFMEDSMRTNLYDHGLADLPKRNVEWFTAQHKRCNQYQDKDIINGCWYDLPEVFAISHNYNLAETYRFCESAPNKTARDYCYIRGSYVISLLPDDFFDPSYSKTLCSLYAPESREMYQCMRDVINAPLSDSVSFLDRILAFCSERPERIHNQCFSMVIDSIKNFTESAEAKKIWCEKLPEEYRSRCVNP